MRIIGFSTGALAKGDFALGLDYLRGKSVQAVELSALRQHELWPLSRSIAKLDLSQFSYVSVHAPSRIDKAAEKEVIAALSRFVDRGWPVIMHPDAITDFDAWRQFGELLFVENMDNRKPLARSSSELREIFTKLPEASFCLDVGHARQVDPTMSEAAVMLRDFGDRLRQLHASEVNTSSGHESLTLASVYAFQRISSLIPDDIPVILETPVSEGRIEKEIESAHQALPEQYTCPLMHAI